MSNEPNNPPFQVGQRVRHKSGTAGTVKACERRVVSGFLRWVVDIDRGDGSKVFQAWPHNCKLVADRPEWPKFYESVETRGPEYRRRFNGPNEWAKFCDGYGNVYLTYAVASTSIALIEVDENGVEIAKPKTEFVADADLEPGTINDQGSFEPTTPLGKLFGREGRFVPAENAKPYDPVAELKSEIETLAKQRDEARDELKEATAEFVRALAIANRERDEANLVAKSNLLKLSEWQAVVVRCEQLLKMNGPPCEHPASSAVPLQLENRLRSLALAEKVIRAAKEVLEQKAT